jgi:hypothetical protein
MFYRVIAFTLATILFLGSPMALVSTSAQGQGGGANITALAIPIVGAATGTITGTFQGAAAITRFTVNPVTGALVAVGTLTGLITDPVTHAVTSLATTFEAVVVPNPGSTVCEILNLVLGPIHLDLLGLVIDTNQIIVNITAVPGAGRLLGNLLCGVVRLLDNGNLPRAAALLNDLLRALPL